jgi:hypothetical protein
MECWNIGIMEYWKTITKRLYGYMMSNPLFHHSIISERWNKKLVMGGERR